MHTFWTQGKTENKSKTDIGFIDSDTMIEANLTCSERHRAFFKSKIGARFSFNVGFQNWLKGNAGKTYGQAVEAYFQILEKKSQPAIDKQFEYNTYIRDFFADNAGKTLKEAIRCWNYKKGLQGQHRYEQSDLKALHEQ